MPAAELLPWIRRPGISGSATCQQVKALVADGDSVQCEEWRLQLYKSQLDSCSPEEAWPNPHKFEIILLRL